jgi:hypothetical protein
MSIANAEDKKSSSSSGEINNTVIDEFHTPTMQSQNQYNAEKSPNTVISPSRTVINIS